MKKVIIIPARYKSSRFPGKPLSPLLGRPAILWTLEAAAEAAAMVGGAEVCVATDDSRIADVVSGDGGKVIMTSEDCANGTERVAEAAGTLELSADDLVINFQGDAPTTPAWFVPGLLEGLIASPWAAMATPVIKCDAESYARFTNDRKNGRVGATTAVLLRSGRVLYFSKEVLPHITKANDLGKIDVYHHVGIYAFRASSLSAYVRWPMGQLERAEQLEQLRFLENDAGVLAIEVDPKGQDFWELNNPEDTRIIESILNKRGA
jgi:3-deoxy-manno-octulosonate cytidylyltransferase (CMP-KDO synthetase)